MSCLMFFSDSDQQYRDGDNGSCLLFIPAASGAVFHCDTLVPLKNILLFSSNMSVYILSALGNSLLPRPLLPVQHNYTKPLQETELFTFLNEYKTKSSSNSCNTGPSNRHLPLRVGSSFPAVLCSVSATGAVAGVEGARKHTEAPLPPMDKKTHSNTRLLSGPRGHRILAYSSSDLAAMAFLH